MLDACASEAYAQRDGSAGRVCWQITKGSALELLLALCEMRSQLEQMELVVGATQDALGGWFNGGR